MDIQHSAPAKILVVDDSPANLLAMEGLFCEPQYDILKALSGQEALKCLLKHDVALLLLDVQMEGMDGFELARIIRQRPKTKDTPIIFISAFFTDEKDLFYGYSLGAFDYMCKPFEPEILKAKVRVFISLYQQNMAIKQSLDHYLARDDKRQKRMVRLEPVRKEILKQFLPDYRKVAIDYLKATRLGENYDSRQIKTLAAKLAGLDLRAKEVTRLHVAVLKEITQSLFIDEARELSLDARLLLVEVLGFLSDNYLEKRLITP